jgi:hypothetical protein
VCVSVCLRLTRGKGGRQRGGEKTKVGWRGGGGGGGNAARRGRNGSGRTAHPGRGLASRLALCPRLLAARVALGLCFSLFPLPGFSSLFLSFGLSSRAAPQLIDDACSLLECDLSLLGATGVEDRLQDGVNSTLVRLSCVLCLWLSTY